MVDQMAKSLWSWPIKTDPAIHQYQGTPAEYLLLGRSCCVYLSNRYLSSLRTGAIWYLIIYHNAYWLCWSGIQTADGAVLKHIHHFLWSRVLRKCLTHHRLCGDSQKQWFSYLPDFPDTPKRHGKRHGT